MTRKWQDPKRIFRLNVALNRPERDRLELLVTVTQGTASDVIRGLIDDAAAKLDGEYKERLKDVTK